MTATISCHDAAALMASDSLFAVFDVRERGEFNARQIANAGSLPRSQIEFCIADLVPNRKIAIVLYDDDGWRATLATRTLAEIGYSNVAELEGGLPAWETAGYPTVSGINVPSKAFGERVHHERNIPDIAPEELKALRERLADLLILDVRTPEEYRRVCIPGGLNVPGGDLILWAEELRRKGTTVVVNCAGRTRSIIGTAALRRFGLTNVRALRNGTMGWVLAGLELESKPAREAPLAPAASREKASVLALRLAEEEGVSWISADNLVRIADRSGDGVSYIVDVRSEAEYEAGHIPGSLCVPGGQAVQRADDFIAVRNGKVIFVSSRDARAVMAAYWYRQMGFHDVAVLQAGLQGWSESGRALAVGAERKEPLGFDLAKRFARFKTPTEVQQRLQDSSVMVLDVGGSQDYKLNHLPGARWISRGWLEQELPVHVPDRDQSLVLSCFDGNNSVLAARTLAEMDYLNVDVLEGGVRAWMAAGYSTETGLAACLVQPNDFVLSPSVSGDRQEMRRYLEWEMKL